MNNPFKKTENNRDKQPEISRRNFLLGSTALAATAGVLAASSFPGVAKAANLNTQMIFDKGKRGQWSKMRPEADYGGISVNHLVHNKEWLGSTQIVGEVPKQPAWKNGFMRSQHGDLGPKSKAGTMSFNTRHPIAGGTALIFNTLGKTEICEGKPAENKLPIPDPEQMSMHIKDLAYFLNADEVGIGMTPEFAVYTSLVTDIKGLREGKPYDQVSTPYNADASTLPYVIGVIVDKHLETFLGSTGYDGISSSQSNRSDAIGAMIVVAMAQYIRLLGYDARASHQGRDLCLGVPCGIACGFGENSRVPSTVAHPKWGFRWKSHFVLTNLPLAPDKPIEFGAIEFCRVCKKCAETCPAQALSYDDEQVVYNGYKRWHFDTELCLHFRTENEEGVCCAQCMKVCPWNSKEDTWFHKAGIVIGSKGKTAANLLIDIDNMFGYGTEIIPRFKWWIDWPELNKIKY